MGRTPPPPGRERRIAGAMLSLAGGEVLGKIVTLITLAWSARVIGVDAFGVFTFGMGLGTLVATIPALAPSSRMVQLVGRRIETLGVRLAALNVLRWVFTVPAVVVAVPFVTLRAEPVDRWTVAFMVAASLSDNTMKVWQAACTALDRQAATAAVIVGQRTATLVFVGAALVLMPNSATVAAAFALGALLANMALAALSRHYGGRPDYRGMRRSHVKEMLVAVPVIGGNSILTEGLARVDIILLGLLVSDAAVGVYGVASRLMETALFVSWTLCRALTPDLVRARDRAELAQPVRIGAVLLFALYVPYGAILALEGGALAALVFGPRFDAGPVLVLLSAAPLLFGIGHLATVVLFARRPTPILPVSTVAALGVNLLLNLLLLPSLHAEAAALAKTAAFAVQAVILGVAVLRLARPRGLLRGIAVTVVATVVACLPVVLGLPLVPAVLLAGTVYCLVWFLLVQRFDRETAEWIERARGAR